MRWMKNWLMMGANGVGGEEIEVLRKMLDGMVVAIRNSGKDGGVFNEGVGADYVHKKKFAQVALVPRTLD